MKNFRSIAALAVIVAGSTSLATPICLADSPASQTNDGAAHIDQAAISQYLALASKAIADGHLIEPRGDNAAEYYVQVLKLDITNRIALDGLHELLPVATGRVERMIASGRKADALRAILLLEIGSPGSYTLRGLRSKAGVS